MRLGEDQGKPQTRQPWCDRHHTNPRVMLTPLLAALARLLHPPLPGLVPAILAHGSAHEQHGIPLLAFPMHACPLEACLNDPRVGTLDHARTTGPASRSKGRGRHLRLARPQVLELLAPLGVRTVGTQSFQMSHPSLGSLVRELMHDSLEPCFRTRRTSRPRGLCDGRDVFGCRSTVPHTHRISTMGADQPLHPLRSVGDHCPLVRPFEPSSRVGSQAGSFPSWHVGQPRARPEGFPMGLPIRMKLRGETIRRKRETIKGSLRHHEVSLKH